MRITCVTIMIDEKASPWGCLTCVQRDIRASKFWRLDMLIRGYGPADIGYQQSLICRNRSTMTTDLSMSLQYPAKLSFKHRIPLQKLVWLFKSPLSAIHEIGNRRLENGGSAGIITTLGRQGHRRSGVT